jgi:ABC-type phosphate/phosphonate transport system substrate-binding protein
MLSGDLDLAYTKSLDYLIFRKKFELRLMFGSVKNGKKTERYLVLVPAGVSVDRLRDLKDKRLVVQREGDIELLYLNLLLLRDRQPEHAEFFSSVSKVSKSSQAVMALFFGKADLCVVSESVLRIMTELNPQIGKRLTVLAASPEVLPWSVFSRKDFSGRARDLALKTALSLKDSPRGRQLLMLFQADAIEETTDADLESLAQLFEEYQRRKPKS